MTSSFRPTLLGRERAHRLGLLLNGTNLEAAELAPRLELDPETLSRKVRGLEPVTEREMARLTTLTGASKEVTKELMGMAGGDDRLGLHVRYLTQRLEAFQFHARQARQVQEYSPHLWPWLLRTRAYTEALYPPASNSAARDAHLEAHTRALVELAQSAGRPAWEFVMHEWALRTPWGTPDQRADQLRHALKLADLPTVRLRVLPVDAGARVGLGGHFALLEYRRYLRAVYRDDGANATFSDDFEDIAPYGRYFYEFWEAALDEDATRDLLNRCLTDTIS